MGTGSVTVISISSEKPGEPSGFFVVTMPIAVSANFSSTAISRAPT